MNRPGISARALALIAVLIVLIAASIVADRLGAPWPVTTLAMLGLAGVGLAVAGITSRTLRLATFRLGSQRLGWSRGGCLMLAIGLGLGLVGSGSAELAPRMAVAAAAGALLFGIFYATPLRMAGGSGLGGFVMARYRSRLLAIVAGLLVATIGFGIAVTAAPGAMKAFADGGALQPSSARGFFLALVLVMLVPGGLASLAATAVIAILLALGAFGLPAMTVLSHGAFAGEVVAQANLALAQADFIGTIGLALIAAGFLGLSGTAAAMRNAGLTRQVSAAVALATLAMAAMVLATSFATSRVGGALSNVAPSRLPVQIYAAQAQGVVTLCGAAPTDPASVERACKDRLVNGVIPPEAVVINPQARGRWMAVALDLPMPVGALWLIVPGVLLTALTAAALRIAVAGLIDDAFYGLGGFSGTASGRLALHRLVMILGGVALAMGALPELSRAQLAIIGALAALVPAVVILPGFSRRANARTILLLLAAACGLALLPVWGIALPGGPVAGAVVVLSVVGLALISVLPSRNADDVAAAAVLRGEAPGPLVEMDA